MTTLLNPARHASGGGEFSPLDIDWDAAYWTEGPNFVAQSFTPDTAITVWPDETATGLDLDTDYTLGFPIYRSADVSMNSQPTLDFFDGKACRSSGTFSVALTQPGTVVSVCKFDSTNNTRPLHAGGWTYRSAGGASNLYAGTSFSFNPGPATSVHFLECVFDSTDRAFRDGSEIGAGNAGASDMTNVRAGGNTPGNQYFDGRISFLGVIDRLLTTQEKSDLLAWSQSHYGTA